MRRQLKLVGLLSLLLLLAALSPIVVVVATARRDKLPLMAAISDNEGRQDVGSSGMAAVATAAEDGTVRRRKDDEAVKTNSGRLFSRRSRNWKQMPAASSPKFNYGGRIPFTADYHSVHRHPPTHN